MRKEGLAHWKKISGYHHRSLAKTAKYLFKQLMTAKLVAIQTLLVCLSESPECSGHLGLGQLWLDG
jgi:hypothetical protein